ncbi:hypothetical protein FA15DRAFT_665142 [Coprinopsis marcescibilis]|uniref:F-box domain-containing protein n=1 Tax=Coprinopsis marcescibilis TaxID=230819 RepID=A0A5C3L7R1_COPMA|nr:hypothetical protein FA15DRAFT_665142 [Coprinopsis marcescibilis]
MPSISSRERDLVRLQIAHYSNQPLKSDFPINRLPPELLLLILLDVAHTDITRHTVAAVVDLACVCRAWHDAILGEPRFWNELRFNSLGPGWLQPITPTFVANLKRWFSRSGSMPLILELQNLQNLRATKSPTETEGVVDFIDFLISTKRWKELSLTIQSSFEYSFMANLVKQVMKGCHEEGYSFWPFLERFSLRTFGWVWNATQLEAFGQLRLTEFGISHVPNPNDIINKTPFNLPNRTLSVLNICVPDSFFHQLLPALDRCSSLISLRLTSYTPPVRHEPARHPHPRTIVTLQRLTKLQVCLDTPALHLVLQSLTTPSLEHLQLGHVRFTQDEKALQHKPILDFIKRSQCALHAITLQDILESDFELSSLLRRLRTVTRVELGQERTKWRGSFLKDLGPRSHGEGTADEALLPLLREFHLNVRNYSFAENPQVATVLKDNFEAFALDPRRWWSQGDDEVASEERPPRLARLDHATITGIEWARYHRVKVRGENTYAYPVYGRTIIEGVVYGGTTERGRMFERELLA